MWEALGAVLASNALVAVVTGVLTARTKAKENRVTDDHYIRETLRSMLEDERSAHGTCLERVAALEDRMDRHLRDCPLVLDEDED